jgi:hypothetical protein
MVMVYLAWITGPDGAELTVTRHKGTTAWIAVLPGGKIIPETGQDVDPREIDREGRYVPRSKADA